MWNTYEDGYSEALDGIPPRGYSDEYMSGYETAGKDQLASFRASLDYSIAKLISIRLRLPEE